MKLKAPATFNCSMRFKLSGVIVSGNEIKIAACRMKGQIHCLEERLFISSRVSRSRRTFRLSR